jgi:2-hydroxy-6-oxonona-2,4-dienedioate hydrolase
MGIERATLAGTSLGGWVSARIAARHPDRVSRLSLISSAGLTSHPSVMHKLKTLTEQASLTSGRDAMKLRLEFVLKNPAAMTEELIDIRHDIYSAPDYQNSVRSIMCLQDMEIRRRNLLTVEEMAKIKAPTLVVWTHDDPTATLSDGRKYADAIVDSRFVVFENSAHMPQLEEPERFNALHLAFMADPKSIESTVAPPAGTDAAADKLTEKMQ